MASHGANKYPPSIIERVNAAHHNTETDEPCQYKFAVIHDDNRPMSNPGGGGIFEDLEAANNAAMDLFMTEACDWFDQVDGWTNFFESGTVAESHTANAEEDCENVVEWSVNARGLLRLTAWSEEGEEITVSVNDFQVDEE
ncbi:hypothetical protein N7478_005663 [Penicillium angulare]|uniref:uncharacterized protein n=1 Tax=Penicillium angulare TaxID=116970 RepID=UPI00253FDD9E|nr:uncharacterized protein N7478_005663 [Penicillium angulare]KAJ5280291.1 hypothetical protein N7478_005663 [Penicillium angulare]